MRTRPRVIGGAGARKLFAHRREFCVDDAAIRHGLIDVPVVTHPTV